MEKTVIKDVKVSVIVPVYNLEKELSECVHSIIDQTHKNLEIILVDDGSTDNSRKTISCLAKEDARIVPIYKNNGGVTSARLAGCLIASGDYIGFVDGDDTIESDMYEVLVNNAVDYNADISHCGYQMVFPDGRIHLFYNTGKTIIQNQLQGIKDLLEGKIVEPGLCNKLYKKELIKGVLKNELMDTTIKINEDLLMNYYLFEGSNKSVFQDVCKYHYNVREGSASRSSLSRRKVIDPIKVKIKISQQCKPELKKIAKAALLQTCIYTYCNICQERAFDKEKEEVLKLIKKNRKYKRYLSVRLRILANGILYFGLVFPFLYDLYRRRIQKKKYE